MVISRKNGDTPDMYYEHTKEIYRKTCASIEPILGETTAEVFVNVLSMLFVAYLVDIHRNMLAELQDDSEDILDSIRKNINTMIQHQRVINMVERANEEERDEE